jgi:hypothetical protein
MLKSASLPSNPNKKGTGYFFLCAGLINQTPTDRKKGDRLLFLICGFDKSNPYEIFYKVACPFFLSVGA